MEPSLVIGTILIGLALAAMVMLYACIVVGARADANLPYLNE